MKTIEYAGYVIDTINVPKHIAIIMDGNGRWATQKGLTRSQGHREGVKRIEDLLNFGLKYQIKEISLYTFSTENWSRPHQEVSYLFRLVKTFFAKKVEKLKKNDICIRVIGFNDRLPSDILEVLNSTQETTKDCKTLCLNLCFNYGGHQDFVYATKNIANQVSAGTLRIDEINEEIVQKALKSSQVSAIDLVIRTSNENRVSNFLPWQISYAEFLFIETLWPDFKEIDFIRALDTYSKRIRRFGGIKS